MNNLDSNQFRKDPIKLLELLREVAPALYTIARLNEKLIRDVKYGEIHLTEFIKNGKIVRVEGYPKIGELVNDLDST